MQAVLRCLHLFRAPDRNLAVHTRLPATSPTCRGAILAAGQLGVFPTRAQFPPSNSTASVAAAGMAALALPEMASALEATTLPPTDAALPPLAVGDGAMGWSPLDLPAEPVSEAPTPAPAWPADGSQCTTILGVLATRRSFTMLLALIRTAGTGAGVGGACWRWICACTHGAWLLDVCGPHA